MQRRTAWALLLTGAVVLALVAILGHREDPPTPQPRRTTSTSSTVTSVPTTATSTTPSSPTASEDGTWSVRWVIDGDTLDVRRGAARLRVRLVNVNAPEVAHEGHPAQCLADAARDRLRALLPVGAPVSLRTFGKDGYGRVIAIVRPDGGEPVNLTLVEEGLAAPLVAGGTVPLIREVRAAQGRAAAAGQGLHSAGVSCSLPARVAALAAAARVLPAHVTATERARRTAQAATLTSAAGQLLLAVKARAPAPDVAGLPSVTQDRLVQELEAVRELVATRVRGWR